MARPVRQLPLAIPPFQQMAAVVFLPSSKLSVDFRLTSLRRPISRIKRACPWPSALYRHAVPLQAPSTSPTNKSEVEAGDFSSESSATSGPFGSLIAEEGVFAKLPWFDGSRGTAKENPSQASLEECPLLVASVV